MRDGLRVLGSGVFHDFDGLYGRCASGLIFNFLPCKLVCWVILCSLDRSTLSVYITMVLDMA